MHIKHKVVNEYVVCKRVKKVVKSFIKLFILLVQIVTVVLGIFFTLI